MADKNTKKAKTVEKMPPTLLVGLGGTGCDIVGRVYKLANDEQKKYLEFVFLDTDANELRERKFEAPFAHTVQTSRKITVGQALRNDPEAFNNTFPINPQLMNKPLTEGAGQIRAVSKLAFDMCVREGRLKELHEAINNLQKLNSDDMEQSIRVLIVSTLVGGTGSGILLPVSMYLRNYLENTCHKKPIIRGFCILPDIFFTDPNKTEIEKVNLRTNAYATLREIDAFMLKADSKRDSDIRKRFGLKMPRPGTIDKYDDYDLNPLDYCFLFDAQNTDGGTLTHFEEYKQHAADCIYASSVSRLHKRLNSSEDNTILERCAQNGRNRYCGTGTSKIIYPFEAVRDYVALNWMSQAMTDDWLRYDNKVARELIKYQKSRAKGVVQKPIDSRLVYREGVTNDIENKNYFGFAIQEECSLLDSSGTFYVDDRWNCYLEKLMAKIKEKAEDKVDDEAVNKLLSACRTEVEETGNASTFKAMFNSIAQQLKMLFAKTTKVAESSASILADSMFSIDNYDPSLEDRIEHWLHIKGVPLHPNSARYFLYNLEECLKKELQKIEAPAKGSGEGEEEGETISFAKAEQIVANFFTEKTHTDESNESGASVTLQQHVNSLQGSFFKKGEFKEQATGILDLCDEHVENIKLYYKLYVQVAVLKKSLEFIDNLCKNYEHFYQLLEAEIKNISYRTSRIEETYENRKGSPVMYVCASKNCLERILAECPNTIDSIQLTADFREQLFEVIYKSSDVSAAATQKKQKQVIEELVSEGILDFWRNAVIDQYGHRVDMDVIDALCKEAEFEEDCFAQNQKLNYVERKQDAAFKLAAPFIDKPIGQPYEILACGMSSAIANKNDLAKMEILKLFGSYEKDSLMDRYQILFMRALYNLRVCDLQKFAPCDECPADFKEEGSYYRDYVARIDNVLPDPEKSNTITPHLDRRWHFTGVMPDLDDETEQKSITRAQKAFFAAFVFGYVKYHRDRYQFVGANGDTIDDEIVVLDGKCDKLHEIYDALRINRPLVRDFIKRFDDSVKEENDAGGVANTSYQQSRLYKALGKMHLNKFPVIEHVSYLELPLLFKVSVGNSEFKDSDAVEMLKNFIGFTEEYLTTFYVDHIVRNRYFVEWLDEQFTLMLSNIEKYYDQGETYILQNPFNDTLLARLMGVIIGIFDKYSVSDEFAEECYKKYEAKRKELSGQ